MRVQRFTICRSNTLSNRREYVSKIEFKDQNGDKSAIGYELDVDGLKVELSIAEDIGELYDSLPLSLKASLKSRFAFDSLINNENLPKELNIFQRQWLYQFLICALVSTKMKKT